MCLVVGIVVVCCGEILCVYGWWDCWLWGFVVRFCCWVGWFFVGWRRFWGIFLFLWGFDCWVGVWFKGLVGCLVWIVVWLWLLWLEYGVGWCWWRFVVWWDHGWCRLCLCLFWCWFFWWVWFLFGLVVVLCCCCLWCSLIILLCSLVCWCVGFFLLWLCLLWLCWFLVFWLCCFLFGVDVMAELEREFV